MTSWSPCVDGSLDSYNPAWTSKVPPRKSSRDMTIAWSLAPRRHDRSPDERHRRCPRRGIAFGRRTVRWILHPCRLFVSGSDVTQGRWRVARGARRAPRHGVAGDPRRLRSAGTTRLTALPTRRRSSGCAGGPRATRRSRWRRTRRRRRVSMTASPPARSPGPTSCAPPRMAARARWRRDGFRGRQPAGRAHRRDGAACRRHEASRHRCAAHRWS